MQFNSEANGLDLYHDALEWVGAASTGSAFTIEKFTRSANFALDRMVALALRADGRWEWQDNNLSTELIDVTTALASGTKKYAISTSWLKIKRVRAKDSSGNYVTLVPTDRSKLTDAQILASGTPWGYDKLGVWVYLFDTPNYASAAGLEVQFQKGADYFATNSTTKEPGFASQFHRLVSLWGALDYVEQNGIKGRADAIRARIGRPPDPLRNDPGAGMEKEFVEFYADRNEDEQPNLSIQREDYGQDALGGHMGSSSNPRGFDF